MADIWRTLLWRPMTTRMLCREFRVSEKRVERALRELRERGLVIKLPHLRCPYGVWVAYPYPVKQPRHKHYSRRVRHRYRRGPGGPRRGKALGMGPLDYFLKLPFPMGPPGQKDGPPSGKGP